jgi:hypothetical protein
MAALIANELMDSDDKTPSSLRCTRPRSTNKTRMQTSAIATDNSFDPLPVEESSDADDDDYNRSSSSSSSDSDVEMITNKEVKLLFSIFFPHIF